MSKYPITKKIIRRRYYLHRKSRECGDVVSASIRTVFIKHEQQPNKYSLLLNKEYHYAIQTQL